MGGGWAERWVGRAVGGRVWWAWMAAQGARVGIRQEGCSTLTRAMRPGGTLWLRSMSPLSGSCVAGPAGLCAAASAAATVGCNTGRSVAQKHWTKQQMPVAACLVRRFSCGCLPCCQRIKATGKNAQCMRARGGWVGGWGAQRTTHRVGRRAHLPREVARQVGHEVGGVGGVHAGARRAQHVHAASPARLETHAGCRAGRAGVGRGPGTSDPGQRQQPGRQCARGP